jgi:alpha-methylacyl-CoA racemase
VIRIDRPGSTSSDTLVRNKRSIVLDVKNPAGLVLLKRIIACSDVVIDPFRPGVLERLGLGPNIFLGEDGLNRGLVYARLAG